MEFAPILAKIFVLGHLIGVGRSLETIPQLECLENAMRLHFMPETAPNVLPFGGHVYLKGFFFTEHCHMDFTKQPIDRPFYFHIPYRSECQVKRVRSIEGENGRNVSGLSYSTIIIVQHHRLFVTNRDKAYAVSCFYRDSKGLLERKLEVGDLSPFGVNGTKEAPVCTYEVLKDGGAIRYANVGDVLFHRWTCATAELGMLVHSCTIRDGLGHNFALLDQRGCVTDSSLLAPLTYTSQLNSSSTPINTFKYADQMVVYFACQITLCDKRENGCEGITPPICELTPLPSEGGPQLPVIGPSRDHSAMGRQRRSSSLMHRMAQMELHFGNNSGGSVLERRGGGHLQLQQQQGRRHNKETNSGKDQKQQQQQQLVTVDVVADRLIVFTTDEGPTETEKSRLLLGAEMPQKGSNLSNECEALPFSFLWPFIWTASALIPLSIVVLLVQWHFFRRKLIALGTYTPNNNGSSAQFEMAGMPSFLGTTPSSVALSAKYGRFG